MQHQKRIIVLKNSRNSSWLKGHSGKHGMYCFKGGLMKEVRATTCNSCALQKKSANWVIVIFCKNNSKKHNNIRIEEILSLYFWDSRLLENSIFWLGDDTNSNIISYVSLRIKNRTWSFQRERNPVWDIWGVHSLPYFSTYLQKVRSKKTYKKQFKF